ncbi:MAG: triacylglycerol lipase [Oscillospiraceae bacterium]|nr:triacylglycerol lipase [Oscillospiraceae bacterium]
MKIINRFLNFILTLGVINIFPLLKSDIPVVSEKLFVPVIILLFVVSEYICRGEERAFSEKKLRRLASGCRLIAKSGWLLLFEIPVLVIAFMRLELGVLYGILSVAEPLILITIWLIGGILRAAVSSRQIKLTNYIALLCLWWMPIANIILIRKFYKTARRELFTESARLELENAREESRICRTKYPVLLVHGIFFRDWQLLNYWGRIPAALKRNGAEFYYGGQQSASSVAESAAELRDRIIDVIRQTGAEKINIIAHSKGGLDSRYAISNLGMDKYVATLTTINTPHLGCDMVDYLLDRLPQGLIDFVTARYNGIFRKLGDRNPDFIAGVRDLSARRCVELNKEMPDSSEVSYRSFMSVMSSAGSAGFPLNIGYMLIKKLNGANDGLVWEKSAVHGDFKLLTTPKKRGISHGDVIDLMRENIDDFDVREMYVQIVSELKNEGY